MEPSQTLDKDIPSQEFDLYETYMNPWKSWIPQAISVVILVTSSILVFVYSSKTWYAAITFLIAALVILFHTRREIYRFELSSKRFMLKSWSIKGRDTTIVRFREIKEVVLEESLDAQGGEETDLYLLLRSGKKIPLMAHNFCGLDHEGKRDAWRLISSYIKGSRTQNELDYNAILQRKDEIV